jgi:FMN phosphatase YigB (HAD superfamily)
VVLSFEIGAVKPEPRIYEVACDRLHVEPRRCIFAGDGDCNELDGALAMGMVAIRVKGTESVALHLGGSAEQTYSVDGLSALTTLVLELLPGSRQ